MILLERVQKAFLRTISGYFRLLIVSMGLIGSLLFSFFTYYEISNAREFALKSFEQTVLLETNYITHWFEDNANRVRTLSQLPSVRRGDLNTFFLRAELFAKIILILLGLHLLMQMEGRYPAKMFQIENIFNGQSMEKSILVKPCKVVLVKSGL